MKKIKNLATNTIEDYTEELEQKLANDNTPYEIGYICNDCGEFHGEDYMTEVNTNNQNTPYMICEHCINNSLIYFYCDDCGNWYDDTIDYYYTQNGNIICESCRDSNYDECEGCHELIHRDDSYYCDECDLCFCESCWNDHCHDDEVLYDYHEFNDWQPHYLPNEPIPDFYIGHELEIDNGSDVREAQEIITRHLPCICMHDGSLSYQGLEMISHPLSYDYMLSKENEYREVFEELTHSLNYKSHDTSTCGLHFHVTRPQNPDIIDRIILFMETYKEEIITFSRRKNNEIASWCNFLSDRRTNINEKELKSLDYIKKYKETSNRYMALNLTNYNTIEFRIFKGTLKYETFMACFEFVYFLTKLASDLTIPIEELTWERVTSNGIYLKQYVDEHDIHTNKPIHDYTTEILIEKNRQREEIKTNLQKAYKSLVKEIHNLTKLDTRKKITIDNMIKITDISNLETMLEAMIRDIKYMNENNDIEEYTLQNIKDRIKYVNERIDTICA